MNPEDPSLPPDPELPKRKPTLFDRFFIICIVPLTLLILLGFGMQLFVWMASSKKKPEQLEAISNLRQVGMALYEFETEYGAFPNDATKDLIAKKHPGHGYNLTGKSSNAMFRQLFAAGLTQSEAIFYVDMKGTRKPDYNISPGEALKKGEVGFGYIAGLSTIRNPARPVVFCPIIPGTDRFDPKPFDRKAVILRIDNSVTSVNIDPHGHAISGGMNLLSPENPIWRGTKPDIRYPEF